MTTSSLSDEMGDREYDVFVSYSTKDEAHAAEVAGRLRDLGYSVFFNADERHGAGHHHDWLEPALDQVFAFVVVVSDHALGSTNVLDEVRAAKARFEDDSMEFLLAVLPADGDEHRDRLMREAAKKLDFQRYQLVSIEDCLKLLERRAPRRRRRAFGSAGAASVALRSAEGDTVISVRERRLQAVGPLAKLFEAQPGERVDGVALTARGDGIVAWDDQEVRYAALRRDRPVRWDGFPVEGVRGLASLCDERSHVFLLRGTSPVELVRDRTGRACAARPVELALLEGATSAVGVHGGWLSVGTNGQVSATGHLARVEGIFRDHEVLHVDASGRGTGMRQEGFLVAVARKAERLSAEILRLDGRRFTREPVPTTTPLPPGTTALMVPRPFTGLAGFPLEPLLARLEDGDVVPVDTMTTA